MPREGFYIIRCPQCGRYTYAPTPQKTRLCVFCQRIFKIDPLNAVFVEDPETARTRVKLYQTGKHHKEFFTAVEKSREKIRSMIPENVVDIERLQEPKPERLTLSSRRRELERVLFQQARSKPVDLHVIEEACEKAGIPWSWAVTQIQMLIRSGHLIAPKPWQIKLVAEDFKTGEKASKPVNLSTLARRIGQILRESSIPLDLVQLREQLDQESILSIDVEKALNLLSAQGYILKTPTGSYRWTSD
ncbi:MAG: hypothetical protein ACFE89_07805 [Candidatus Hodarchaeota archaeon]